MKNLTLPVVLVAMLSSGCDQPTEPIAATKPIDRSIVALQDGVTKEHIWYEDDYVFWSLCAQEFVQLSGREQVIVTTTVEEGKTTFRWHGNTAQLRGLGLTSGADYVFAASYNGLDTYYSEPPFAFEIKQWGGGQVTVVKGEGQWTRLQVIRTLVFDGTTFTEISKRVVEECPRVTPG